MKLHDEFHDLAAAGIDFPLSAVERSRLDAHLSGCTDCARYAARLRADAQALAELPRITLPGHRGAEILQAAMHPVPARHPLRLVLIAALLGLLAIGSITVGAELLRRSQRDLSVVIPIPTGTAGPDASGPPATTSPSPTLKPEPPDVLLAYVADEQGRSVIRTMRSDGTETRTIAEGASPAWSPDGRMLAFECPPSVATQDLPASDICVTNADGSASRVLVRAAAAPAWSPDGTSVMFARSVIDAGDTWLVDLDGSGERLLGPGTGSWSPDGASILLVGASGGAPDATVIRPDGSGARQLGTCWGAAWSPDGTRLACTEDQGAEDELRTVRVADGVMMATYSEQAQIAGPTWLTDDMIAVTLSGSTTPLVEAGEHLYLVDWDGPGPRKLLSGAATMTSVAPDGAWLALTTGARDVHIISVDGDERALTTDGASADAQWQPWPGGIDPRPPAAEPEPFSRLGFDGLRTGSQDVAWASTGNALYRTADAGTSWNEVRVPGGQPHRIAAAIGPDTLFLVLANPATSVSVTRDGGRSWAEVDFPAEHGGTLSTLSFASTSHGFAHFEADGSPAHVYETYDGGRTWAGPATGSMPTGPMGGKSFGADGLTWVSNGKADDRPFDNRLWLSRDGGVTWSERRFPIGPGAGKNDLKTVDALWADGGRVVLAMSADDGPLLYTSDDGGSSWTFVRSWSSFLSGNTTVGYRTVLLSGAEWVLVAQDGSGSWSTADAGASWRQVKGAPTAVLDEVYVASADRFWAVHRCSFDLSVTGEPDPTCGTRRDTMLLVTSDGGRTWAQVKR